ncbi:Putative FAD-binding domain, FAD/NAD(P)-binding domain superfamily [Colletotrichum destructivum]|uniref:FAD-binding domain, FAD/NAD(P)-binding domain superfamily n=1 Tax=Colletotrichum destructivum TaxID=34406 RepID=A0AAX4IET8_9PEZI|nr:Putative FAD-binding domain, FAD/NAD(P)-binding domain superfamily [Colletotrichum destructivum]
MVIPSAAETAPDVYKLANKTAFLPTASPDVYGYDLNDLDAAQKALLILHRDWSQELTEAIVKAEGDCTVTVIGDTAYSLTPLSGEGVNVTLEDAMKLASAIIHTASKRGDPDLLDWEIKAFENEMPIPHEESAAPDEGAHARLYVHAGFAADDHRDVDNEACQVRDTVGVPSAGCRHGAHVLFFMRRLLAP